MARWIAAGHSSGCTVFSNRAALSVAMVGAMLRLAFERLELRRVTAVVLSDDEGTRACLEKAGFVEEGRLRDMVHWELHDVVGQFHILLAVLCLEWRPRAAERNEPVVTIAETPPADPAHGSPDAAHGARAAAHGTRAAAR